MGGVGGLLANSESSLEDGKEAEIKHTFTFEVVQGQVRLPLLQSAEEEIIAPEMQFDLQLQNHEHSSRNNKTHYISPRNNTLKKQLESNNSQHINVLQKT